MSLEFGFAHVGVSTHDMKSTIEFYSGVLGCPVVAEETIEISDGGVVRQTSFDVGSGQYMVFMEAKGISDIREDYDTSINKALGVPGGMYHYAFTVSSLEVLKKLADKIRDSGTEVSEITDLGTAKAVFLNDPNGLQIELSVKVREFTTEDIGVLTQAGIAEN